MENTISVLSPSPDQSLKNSKNPNVQAQLPDSMQTPRVDYSPAELAYRSELIYNLNMARDQRDRPHPELDNQTYIEYYESNRRKDLSYIPPKKNKQDVRIVTGLTREKDTTLLNAGLSMDLEPDITAFDSEDMVVNELGDNIGDWVQKSREIEDYNKKRSTIYREMIAQGDVFVQELWTEDFRNVPISELTWDPIKDGISQFSFKERLQKVFEKAECRMVNGKKVFLGSIRTQFIEDQHMVAILNIYPRDKAQARYGQWERWKNVPRQIDTAATYYDDGTTYKDWNLVSLDSRDRVAEIIVFWPERNRFMIMLNGVMMLPIDYALTYISPSGEIPMAQGKLEPISDFAYSKSQPSKVKVDQEILDEITKLMVEKTRQSFKPPLGNRGKKQYSQNVFLPGKITTDIQEGELYPILGTMTQGVTAPEFQFYKTIKESIDTKTSDPNFAGDEGDANQTATETIELKNKQMMQLGLFLDGLVNLERRMTWNRIQTLLCYWTKEISDNVDDVKQGIWDGHKSFAVNTTVDDGQTGTKVFRMTKGDYPNVDDHQADEDQLTEKHGHPTRIVYLNPQMLREVKYKWFIIIKPRPKSNDKLTQLMFIQNLQQAIGLFGPQAINQEYAKQRYSIIIGEDYSKFFTKMSIQQMLQAGGSNNPAVANATGAKPLAQPGQRVGPLAAAMQSQ